MYIDADTINNLAKLVGSLAVLCGVVVAAYKYIERDKRQSKLIHDIQEEQTLICYGLRGALRGLIEQGCNGPCKDAPQKPDKHLNKEAHHQGGEA